MRISGCLTSKVAHQQGILQGQVVRHRQPDGIAIARGHRHGFAFAILHMLKGEIDVTLRGHQLKAVADAELIFDRHGRQRAVTLSGEFADKLLALGDGVAVLVVLIIVMGMAAQEAFGVPAVGQPLQGLQQAGVERFAGGGIVDRLAVNLSGACAVVEGFGAAFDLQQ